MNIYLIDFENTLSNFVKGIDNDEIENEIYLFYTAEANKICLDALSGLKTKPHFIKVPSGNQSLDKHLVSYLGYLLNSVKETDKIIIISNDTGYQAIAKFWNEKLNRNIIEIKEVEINKEKEEQAEQTEVKKETKTLKKTIEINNKIMTELRNNKIKDPTNGKITSLVIKLYKENATKQKVYTSLVHEYGAEKGRRYYKIVKPII